ncbi:hypothetical protein K443DRAFT_685687 [Laccaria amethystina LaAM-08-1]|uniref:Uncharacterized protein n=1 Tax=Laccaria amethystina LaAM-08-1 TaxID=1095629 RepID=A0A0C9WTY6_9AGAR|nr:hypothetical protein K443DRAFT_685687 [Laccaria amethystina LaAM-08-1]
MTAFVNLYRYRERGVVDSMDARRVSTWALSQRCLSASVLIPVLLTSLTSAMLVKRTRPQPTDFYWIGIGFFRSNSTFGLPPGNLLQATLQVTEETPFARVDGQSFLQGDNGLSIPDVPDVFNDAQLDDGNTLSKSSTCHAKSLPST